MFESIFRHPRSTQERRAVGRRGVIQHDEYRIFIRGKRRHSQLPDSYDDIIKSNFTNLKRSWKYKTKNRHQYD